MAILDQDQTVKQPWLEVAPVHWPQLAQYLRDTPELAFDFLHCLTGVDYGLKVGKVGVIYHLSSLLHEHQLVIKITLPYPVNQIGDPQPGIPSVAHIWRAADWHEREAYDLVGIPFQGHPDLRRMLLPEDWQGHPLRKDYQTAESYHDIQIDY